MNENGHQFLIWQRAIIKMRRWTFLSGAQHANPRQSETNIQEQCLQPRIRPRSQKVKRFKCSGFVQCRLMPEFDLRGESGFLESAMYTLSLRLLRLHCPTSSQACQQLECHSPPKGAQIYSIFIFENHTRSTRHECTPWTSKTRCS
jgi:hypothetical protein